MTVDAAARRGRIDAVTSAVDAARAGATTVDGDLAIVLTALLGAGDPDYALSRGPLVRRDGEETARAVLAPTSVRLADDIAAGLSVMRIGSPRVSPGATPWG